MACAPQARRKKIVGAAGAARAPVAPAHTGTPTSDECAVPTHGCALGLFRRCGIGARTGGLGWGWGRQVREGLYTDFFGAAGAKIKLKKMPVSYF